VYLDYKKTDNAVIIYLKGHVDIAVTAEIEEKVKKLISEEPERHFILNMHDVDYVSSSGLGIFISILGVLKDSGLKLLFCNMDSNIKRLFKIIKLTEMFDILQTEEDALALLEKG